MTDKERVDAVKAIAWEYYLNDANKTTYALVKILEVLGEYPKKVGGK